jgi:hypothetical protein
MRLLLFLCAWCCLTLTTHAQFAFQGFDGTEPIGYYGTASVVAGAIQLTPAVRGGTAGAAWHNDVIRLDTAWTLAITYSVESRGGDTDPGGLDGGDGLAIVLAASADTLGLGGYGLGYDGIARALAVEIDLWDDTYLAIPPWECERDGGSAHLAIQGMLNDTLRAMPAATLATVRYREADEAIRRTLVLRYDPPLLRVFVPDLDPCLPVLMTSVDINHHPGDRARLGLTAGTQSAFQRHLVWSWCFRYDDSCALCPPPARDTVRVRDTVTQHDTVHVRDTLQLRDTVTKEVFQLIYRPIPVYIERHDTVRSRYTVTRFIPIWLHDTLRVETVRDTCADRTLRVDSTVCGYADRAFEMLDSLDIAAAPVPALGVVTLHIRGEPQTLELFDERGFRMLVRDAPTTPQVVLRDLAKGLYVAVARRGDETAHCVFVVLD